MQRLEFIIQKKNTVVIKIGTNLLADKVLGIHGGRLEDIARSVGKLRSLGYLPIAESDFVFAGLAGLMAAPIASVKIGMALAQSATTVTFGESTPELALFLPLNASRGALGSNVSGFTSGGGGGGRVRAGGSPASMTTGTGGC